MRTKVTGLGRGKQSVPLCITQQQSGQNTKGQTQQDKYVQQQVHPKEGEGPTTSDTSQKQQPVVNYESVQ